MKRHNLYWLLQNYQIVFPLIQRDYAQGRSDSHSTLIRKSFISSLLNAIKNKDSKKPLILGFIFGSSKEGQFVPFDGQQRLSTLFLLYLYAAVRDKFFKDPSVQKIFYKMRYEARQETSIFMDNFLKALAGSEEFQNLFSNSQSGNLIAQYVKKQPWFSPAWYRDQSIGGFLISLDEIKRYFISEPELWKTLINQDNAPVQFYFADIINFDASGDDLFIKMNARGKGLGHFEKFKAAFLEWLKMEYPHKEEIFAAKFDQEWQDLFWKAFGKNYKGDKAHHSDSCFYNFLNWFSNIIIQLTDPSPAQKKDDLLHKITLSLQTEPFLSIPDSNLTFMENILDSLAMLEKIRGVEDFLKSVFLKAEDDTTPQKGKISWYHNVGMFKEICHTGILDTECTLMFFACILLLVKNFRQIKSEGEENWQNLFPNQDQLLQLRMIRNLVENSRTEIANASMSSLLEGIEHLINKDALPHVFNSFQLSEELAKMEVRRRDPELAENLDWLEDHPQLRGCVAIFSVKNSYRNKLKFEAKELKLGKRLFEKVLGDKSIPWDTLLRAFLTENIFGLREGSLSNKYFYMGRGENECRRKIFTTSRADCFSEIRDSVQKFGEKIDHFSDQPIEVEISKLIYKWVEKNRQDKKMDWRWYFVAYPEILPSFCQTDGFYDWKYSWKSFEQRQLQKQILKGSHRNPFLWAVYVEAGFFDPEKNRGKVKFHDASGKDKDNPIAFPAIKLGLWGGELFWRIYTINGHKPDKRQIERLEELKSRLEAKGIKINQDGYCFIQGKDSQKWSTKAFSPEKTADIIREYDKIDRVDLGKKIAQEMFKLC